MFEQLEKRAKQMIDFGEDEITLSMWVDGHWVTANIMVTKPAVEEPQQ